MRKYYAFYPNDARTDLNDTLETNKKTKKLLEMATETTLLSQELPPLYFQIVGAK